jgi:hypothetical protein
MLQEVVRHRPQTPPYISSSLCRLSKQYLSHSSHIPLLPRLNVHISVPVLITLIWQVAIRAVPRRNVFYMRIAQGGSVEKLDTELAKWLTGLAALVSSISEFLEGGGYGKV